MKKIIAAFSAICLTALSFDLFAYGQDWDSRYSDPYPYKQHKKQSAKRSHSSYKNIHAQNRHHRSHKKTSHSEGGKRRKSERTDSGPPIPKTIAAPGQKTIKIDLSKRVFGAYDVEGNLLKWGRISGGKNYCPDIGKSCRTPTGTFTIYSKKGSECKSSRFPLPNGGAKMPYCMHFHGGYAMHGGHVPNYNASHGCVRMHAEDAKWLNHNFVQVGSTKVNITR